MTSLTRLKFLRSSLALAIFARGGWRPSFAASPSFDRPQCRIGEREVLLTAPQRRALGLKSWPDGTMGFLRQGGLLDAYAANDGKIAKTRHDVGTGRFETVYAERAIAQPRTELDYAGGGPVLRQADGAILLMYHAERHPEWHQQHQAGAAIPTRNYSSLGLAASTDDGANFVDLGEIITPGVSLAEAPPNVEIGGGGFVAGNGTTSTYFRDVQKNGQENQLAVARVSGQPAQGKWWKYFQGGFGEPAIGGQSTRINDPGQMRPIWFSVAFCEYLDLLVIVFTQIRSQPYAWEIHLAWSKDGIDWSAPQAVETEVSEATYPSLLGLGSDPAVLGQDFYVYYTVSEKGGGNRWIDASLARRRVRLT